MKTKVVGWLFVFFIGMIFAAPLSWAKENCYNFMVAYSYRDKVLYHTPVFTSETKGVSYNEQEYVSDTVTSMKMEDGFQKYLVQKMQVKSFDLTVNARVAYKTEDIARVRMDKEVGDFRFRGFTIKEVPGFRYGK